jgi:hypothetical protein
MRSALRSSKTSKRKKVRARIVWQEDTKLDHIRFFDAKSPANHNRGENFTFDKKDVSMYEDEAPPWEVLQQQRATTLNQPTDDPSISFTVPPRRPRRKSWEIPPREVSVLEASGHFSLPPRRLKTKHNQVDVDDNASEKESDLNNEGDEGNESDVESKDHTDLFDSLDLIVPPRKSLTVVPPRQNIATLSHTLDTKNTFMVQNLERNNQSLCADIKTLQAEVNHLQNDNKNMKLNHEKIIIEYQQESIQRANHLKDDNNDILSKYENSLSAIKLLKIEMTAIKNDNNDLRFKYNAVVQDNNESVLKYENCVMAIQNFKQESLSTIQTLKEEINYRKNENDGLVIKYENSLKTNKDLKKEINTMATDLYNADQEKNNLQHQVNDYQNLLGSHLRIERSIAAPRYNAPPCPPTSSFPTTATTATALLIPPPRSTAATTTTTDIIKQEPFNALALLEQPSKQPSKQPSTRVLLPKRPAQRPTHETLASLGSLSDFHIDKEDYYQERKEKKTKQEDEEVGGNDADDVAENNESDSDESSDSDEWSEEEEEEVVVAEEEEEEEPRWSAGKGLQLQEKLCDTIPGPSTPKGLPKNKGLRKKMSVQGMKIFQNAVRL